MLIFVSGGVRSGKTSFAERLAKEAAGKKGKLNYIAAGRAADQEMVERIAKHQQERFSSALPWHTYEQPRDLHLLSSQFTKNDIVVVDCLTTWLNNEMFSANPPEEVSKHLLMGIQSLERACSVLILVSNELFYDAQPYSKTVLAYQAALGEIHQDAVRKAQSAFLVENGIPVLMKGARQ
ncbi:bifunctional adenosylcobinamide kinase/adenosylcobinamide-phosphate guanylyltransferase [Bacillus sp. FJAT-42376]|uniref:bifunctional adenosylcobinamide kinase/adenosylcobinamide-phosphate guanylyltransferase n=1 Tax=Bacillus sp. FJAT-42376 TaxID=2014076 RepID=UPI0013DDC866|nr:bifunctional adenosylcobinamide kinase/adenosylcobinamide-phosphate guanylyltransferase [Bacillus sp. FJAT-42376]